MQAGNKFRKRVNILILTLLGWTLICIGAFFYYAVIAKDEYIRLGNKLARRELSYYPERGRILDKNGIVLAWSEKYYDLYFNNLTDSRPHAELIYRRVAEVTPEARKPDPGTMHSLMLRGLRPKQVLALEKLIYFYQELQVSPRIERKVVDYPEVRARIGKVKYIAGRLVGISGYERKFNQLLSGTPGKFIIMLDRNKNWIKNSGQSLKPATPGKDLILAFSLEELRRRGMGSGQISEYQHEPTP
ncbi:MAG: hypothetical protein PHV59_09575 [Victivallales bacterium]|nr:hypothetical protein [Victivallales bacterium]